MTLPAELLPRGGFWLGFPDSYRTDDVKHLANWLRFGYSGAVIGGSGSGKSNLCGFLMTKPHVLVEQMDGNLDDYLFCHFDVNSLPSISTEYFYRGLLRTLKTNIVHYTPEINQPLLDIMSIIGPQTDVLTLSHTLDEVHKLIIRNTGRTIIWLIDRFDEACRQLDVGALNNLRWLRDQSRFAYAEDFRNKLAFVLFTRQPLERLRDRDEITDFVEIIEDHTTWIGPMSRTDTLWNIKQIAKRNNTKINEFVANIITDLSGGLTSFAKTIAESYIDGKLSGQNPEQWTETMLALPACDRISQEIVDELRESEVRVLELVADGSTPTYQQAAAVQYLKNLGYLIGQTNADDTETLHIVSPILEARTAQTLEQEPLNFTCDKLSGTIKLNGKPITDQFAPLEAHLMRYLLKQEGHLCRRSELEDELWPHDVDVDANRSGNLNTVVKDLRKAITKLTGINQSSKEGHTYITTVRGQGFRYDPPM